MRDKKGEESVCLFVPRHEGCNYMSFTPTGNLLCAQNTPNFCAPTPELKRRGKGIVTSRKPQPPSSRILGTVLVHT